MRAKPHATDGRRTFALALALLLLGSTGGAADVPTWHIGRGDVRITVPLKPGGAFTATTSALSGTVRLADPAGARPLRLAGDVVMDLSTIDTGIGLRNQHLRENYLEIGKGAGFDKAVLSDIRLADADGEAFDGTTAFTATMALHGVAREVAGKAEVRREGAGRRVNAEFPVSLSDFAIATPSYLGVGVGNKLLVKVQLTATPTRSGAP